MGIFADFLSGAKSVDNNDPVTALDRAVHRDFDEIIANGDAASPGAAFDAANEVQTLAASGATAGTFDISVGFNTVNGNVFVAVTGIAYNAAPAAIESAIDSAVSAAGTVPGWTNGDISVSGAGTAQANPTVFTYDGASVASLAHPISTVDGTGLTGGGSEAFSETTAGQTARSPWAIIEVFDIIDFGGTPPAQLSGSIPTLTGNVDRSRVRFTDRTLRAIAAEAEAQDKIAGLEAALLSAMNLNPNPPASSQG